jgi:hypothetical protein
VPPNHFAAKQERVLAQMQADQTGFTLMDRGRTDIAHKTLSAPRTIRVFGVHPLSSALESFLALPRIGALSGHGGGRPLDLARPSDAK